MKAKRSVAANTGILGNNLMNELDNLKVLYTPSPMTLRVSTIMDIKEEIKS